MVVDLILTLGDQQSAAILRVIAEIKRQVGARHHRQVGAITQDHQQVAVMGIGERHLEMLLEVVGIALKPAKP